jgi:NitT/TauT family transport system substrate-binding protein
MNRASCLAATGSALLLPLRAAPVSAQPAPLTTVRVGAVPTDSLSPVLYAIRYGLFERAGLKIDLQILGGGDAVSLAVISGALDIGLTSVVAIMQAHLKNIPVTIIAPGGLWINANVAGLLVPVNSPLHAAPDFNGKTIATSSLLALGTVAMDAWMDRNGGDSKTLRFLELPWVAAPAALQQGRIDAAIVDNPVFAQALGSGQVRVATLVYGAIAKQFLLGVWFTTLPYVEKNRGITERFSRVIADAASISRTHPETTIDDVAQITKLDRNVIARMERVWVGTTVKAADIQPVIDVGAKYKLIDRSFPAADLINAVAAR